MEQSRFDDVTRLLTKIGTRRAALSVAATSGLATGLGAASMDAEAKKDVSAERRRRRRRKRGKRGKKGAQGPAGPQGPPVGADAVVVTETCTLDAPEEGDPLGVTRGCTASCDNGFAAVGGGFEASNFLSTLGVVRSSFPETDGNKPTGWTAEVEFVAIGQDPELTVYAVCVPA